MTYYQCQECMGDGTVDGVTNCPDCYGWGEVDDREFDDDGYFELPWPTISDAAQFGY